MGNKVSQNDSADEETQPILSGAATGIQSDDDGSAMTNTIGHSFYNAASANGTGPTYSSRNYVLKTEQRNGEQLIRLPFTYSRRYGTIDEGEDANEQEERNRALARRARYFGRLDPRPDSILAVPDHVVPDDYLVRLLVPTKGKQSSIVTIFVFWNTMMGTSLLSMPWAIQQAGFIGGLALLIVMPLIMLYTSYLVLKSVELEPRKTFFEFSDVCEYFLGKISRHMATLSSLVTLLGGAIVYWILLSSFLFNIVVFIHKKATSDSSDSHNRTDLGLLYSPSSPFYDYPNTSYPDVFCPSNIISNATANPTMFEKVWKKDLTVPLLLLVVLLPLVNFKSVTLFTRINSLGVFSVLFLTVFAIVKAVKWGVHLDLGIDANSEDPYYIPDFKWTFPALTGISALAYFVHNCILTITSNQKKPEHNFRDLVIAYILVTVSYVFIGTVIYITFPLPKDCLKDNFLNNIAANDWMAFFAQIMMYFQMTCVFPLVTFVIRSQLLKELFNSVWPSFKHVLVLNLVLFGICVTFAIFLPHIGKIIGFVGAFCGFVYAITLPCLVHMVAQRRKGKLSWVSLCFHGFLICFGLANFISQFLIMGKTS